MDTYFKKTAKERKDEYAKKNDTREARIKKYNDDVNFYKNEVWQDVKQYYRDIEQYDKDKKEKEKVIMDRLAAYYNAASGQKAEEMRKRAEAIMKSVEEGQVLNQNILEKLERRQSNVINMIEQKGLDVKKINDISE